MLVERKFTHGTQKINEVLCHVVPEVMVNHVPSLSALKCAFGSEAYGPLDVLA
jgi:hypothetical protein